MTGASPLTRIWQVKASTLCNYRCHYCYEWDRLADARRMPITVWRGLFEAIRVGRADGDRDRIVWHGGEPLLLPPGYVLEVLALQRARLGVELAAGAVTNAVQTNLSRLNETLELMVAAGFLFSVSIDGAPGVRRTAGGRDGDAVALRNVARLRQRGVPAGVLLVLGRHNIDRLVPLHDRLAELEIGWLNIVTAFDVQNGAPGDGSVTDPDEAAAALAALHAHRQESGCRMPVEPLGRAEAIARRRLSGRGVHRAARRRIIVERDGRLRLVIGGRPAGRVGQGARAVPWDAPEWLAASRALGAREARICSACRYREACDDQALSRRPWTDAAIPCPVETRLIAALEDRIAGRHRRRAVTAAGETHRSGIA